MTEDDKIRFIRGAIYRILRDFNISEDTRRELEEALQKTREEWIEYD